MSVWAKRASDKLVGKRIVQCRYLTDDEAEAIGWDVFCLVLVLDDGTVLFPSQDDEGNGPGALFGSAPNGTSLTFPVI